MTEALLEDLEKAFPGKSLLTVSDICQFLGCSQKVVYNWMKRSDPGRRPPRLKVGQEIKFPRLAFVQWLAKEQK